jgi:hypothetical protein
MALVLTVDGAQFGSSKARVPQPDGSVADVMVLHFVDQQSGIRVDIPLSEEGREGLRQLLGGSRIQVAGMGDVPGGVSL